MTTERDPRTRIVLSWLHEDAHEDAERVLLRALDEVDATSQRGRSWPARRLADMNSFAKLAIAAAAVVVIALAGIQFLPRSGTSGGQPSPTPTPTATPAFAQLTKGPLAPGRYALYEGLATSIEVPAGWIGKPPFVRKIGADGAGLWWGPTGPVSQVFSDACKGPNLTPVDGTVRSLVDALDAQVGIGRHGQRGHAGRSPCHPGRSREGRGLVLGRSRRRAQSLVEPDGRAPGCPREHAASCTSSRRTASSWSSSVSTTRLRRATWRSSRGSSRPRSSARRRRRVDDRPLSLQRRGDVAANWQISQPC